MAFLGVTFAFCFILLRTCSFHWFDVFLRWQTGEMKMAWVMEISGALCVVVSAGQAIRREKSPVRRLGAPASINDRSS